MGALTPSVVMFVPKFVPVFDESRVVFSTVMASTRAFFPKF